MKKLTLAFLQACLCLCSVIANGQPGLSVDRHLEDIRKHGKEPHEFVRQSLSSHDLIVFDDAVHSANEPFRFYINLLQDTTISSRLDYIFIEVFGINSQPFLDKYFSSANNDSSMLASVFQNDFAGIGWRYQSYVDLLSAIWNLNKQLPEEKRLKVMGVDQPIYWEAIHTREDYDIFQESLIARDYFMYKKIAQEMDDFTKEKKALFLTNTRHAYKNIRKSTGELYENVTTLLHHRFPGHVYSIRLHNVNLSIEKAKTTTTSRSAEGLDKYIYRWVKTEDGVWDKAFDLNENRPVAIPLAGTVFGNAAYIGNHMLNVYKNQTMNDAYDGLIFLAPVEKLHRSAIFDFIYTDDFRKELKRRLLLLNNGDVSSLLKKENCNTLEDYIEKIAVPSSIAPLNMLK